MQESNESLAVRIQAGERDLLPLLWNQVRGFVMQQAIRWAGAWQQSRPDITTEDLYQSGYIALCEAVETFRRDKNNLFVGWLRFYLQKQFAEELGCRTDKKRQDPLGCAVSLDAPIGGDTEDITLGDAVGDSEDPYEDIEEALYRQQIRTVVREALEDLLPVEQEALQLRYYDGLTYKEAASCTGLVSPESFRRREIKALRHLRRSKHATALREAWYGERNLYRHTSRGAWSRSGCSVQEYTIIQQENAIAEKERNRRTAKRASRESRIQFYEDELGYDSETAQYALGTDAWRVHT